MEDIGELQDLVKDQLMRHAQTKYKPSLFSATTSSSSLKFSDASSSSVATQLQPQTLTQPSSLLLNFEPSKEYQRSSRVIKHTGDRYVVGTDYTDLQSLGSQSKSFARTAKPKFPEYSSLSSRASSSYMKGQSRGKLRKVTLTKLESLTRSYESKSSNRGVIADNDSLSLSLSSMKSNSLDELFAAKFMEREETKKELDAERFFTSKVQTPRLVQEDSEARFKSKDLLNSMIEDVSRE